LGVFRTDAPGGIRYVAEIAACSCAELAFASAMQPLRCVLVLLAAHRLARLASRLSLAQQKS
jgi:uncharacterized membrane protein AbrB (regulator of aidB expression)